ncbi:hypothetical protein KYU33_004669 [Salmonella enterica]|nr:hypothetical protein [Salmonella enterica]
MTTTTPAILAEQARKRGTPILELAPCEKCREPSAIYFYEREGRAHNGCLWCHYIESRLENAADKQELLTTAYEADDNGNAIYQGRACKVCGGKTRLVGTAYGTKNKGACLVCAVHQQSEKEHGKEIKRLNRAVTEKAHKFIVQSIERSGVVEVAPRTQQEYFELRELVYKCEVANQRERNLSTGIRWELGHKFPAAPAAGELRGKATIDNIVLVQYGLNRTSGNTLPDEWEQRQVINIEGCRAIQRSYEAAKAWKEAKTWEQNLTPAERKARTQAERQANEEHCKRVAAICSNAARVIDFFTDDWLPTFEHMHRAIRSQWVQRSLKMERAINAFIQSGKSEPYTTIRENRFTVEAFCGAVSRLWLVVQTFDQLADAEAILSEQGMSTEQASQLQEVKRYAVQWAQNILDNPQVLVMGFTHPLLSVLGDWRVWGTEEGADGKQWLCAWRQSVGLMDRLTPFDGTAPDLDFVNKALLKQELLTHDTERTPDLRPLMGWQNTADDFAYEQARERKAREAREQRKREQEAAQEAQRAENAAILSRRKATEIKAAVEGLGRIENYAAGAWSGQLLEDAQNIIRDVWQQAHQQQAEIEQCETLEGLNSWLVCHNWQQRQMRDPAVVFADLIRPF